MNLRELLEVLRCRPRERDALGGTVTESAAFISPSAFRRDFNEPPEFRFVEVPVGWTPTETGQVL